MKAKKPGRPKSLVPRVKFTTTLPAVTVKWLRVLGNSSASHAIEWLVDAELENGGLDFWEQIAKDAGWWDETMKVKKVKARRKS